MVDLISKLIATKSDDKLQFTKTQENNEAKQQVFATMLDNEVQKSNKDDEILINIQVDEPKMAENKKTEDKKENEDKSGLMAFIVNLKNNQKNQNNDEIKLNKINNKNSIELLSETNEKSQITNGKKNIQIKLSDIDIKSQDKVKFILKEMNSGKIDEKVANEIILQTVLNSKNEKLNKIDKNKISGIQIERKDKNDRKDDTKNLKIDNKKNIETNSNLGIAKPVEKEKKDEFKLDQNVEVGKMADKKDDKIDLRSKKNQEKVTLESIKERDTEPKDIKNEIKFDINEAKLNSSNPKERSNEIQKTFSDNKERIFDSIAKNTKIIQGNGETRFSTIFRPDDLGRVDFKLNIKDGKFDGKLIVQNQESFDFFRNNIEDLRAVFQKSNVELGKLDITLAGAGLNYGEDFSQNGKGQNSDKNEVFSIGNYHKKIERTFEENTMNSNINYYAFNDKRINIFA
ncbi:MAG TPA: flagellar hook-length control protein FliK [Spirochaetota bacterium]|nr:flagellar hook-length control protein FliK [Spirochaetota bacterium]